MLTHLIRLQCAWERDIYYMQPNMHLTAAAKCAVHA